MKDAAASTNTRWRLWLPLLGVASWLAFFADKTPSASEAMVSSPALARAPAAPSSAAPSPAIAASGLVPRDQLIAASGKESARDLFAARSWTPPPPPPQTPPPEKPVAPPVPFTFLGKKLEDKGWEIFLARGDQTLIVKAGSIIDGTWRVDSAEPPNLVMTYLPLNETQTLAIGDTQ